MKSWRRRRAPEAQEGQPEIVPEDESVNPFGAEHAWWAERPRLQRVFVASKAGDDTEEPPEFWQPESLFTYGPSPDAEIVDEVPPDPYEVLGLAFYATWDEIASAYRALAKKHHPDLYIDATEDERAEAEARMREVNRAYQELVDQRRAASR